MTISGDLSLELATFEAHRAGLEREHFGRYVVVQGNRILGLFDDCDTAARQALSQLDDGSRFLLREIGRDTVQLSLAAELGLFGAGPLEDPS